MAWRLERRQRQHADHHRREAQPGGARPQPLALTSRGDELGRRRLAGRDRRFERVAPGEHRGHHQCRGRPFARLLLEAGEDAALERRLEAGHQRRRIERPLVAVTASELGEALALEGTTPGHELVDHEAERVDVAAYAHLAPRKLLGRHVGRGARAHVLSRERLGEPGEAEVGEAHLALAVEHHIGGLQVAVQQALRVRGGEAFGDLAGHVERLVLREAPDAPQQRGEVLPVHELHREEVLPFRFADVPDAAHRWMRDLARRPHLRVEALEPVRVALEPTRQELERDGLLQLQVVGAIDLPHPAAAEQAHDPVALGDDGARNEAVAATPAGRFLAGAGRDRARGPRRRARRAVGQLQVRPADGAVPEAVLRGRGTGWTGAHRRWQTRRQDYTRCVSKLHPNLRLPATGIETTAAAGGRKCFSCSRLPGGPRIAVAPPGVRGAA